MVAGKILAHWLVCGLPLVVLAPVIGLQFDLGASAIGLLMLTLLLGTPTLSMIGAVGASLTLGARGGGALLSLLVLPLYIPVLIFGAGAVNAHLAGLGAEGHLSLLAALFIFAAVFAPWVAAVSIRISLE
jgi:heme exporter protein B